MGAKLGVFFLLPFNFLFGCQDHGSSCFSLQGADVTGELVLRGSALSLALGTLVQSLISLENGVLPFSDATSPDFIKNLY